MLKITVLPPRQVTSVASTVSVKLRSRVQIRIAKRASRSTSDTRSAHGGRHPAQPRARVAARAVMAAARLEAVEELRFQLAPVLAAHARRPEEQEQTIQQAGHAH